MARQYSTTEYTGHDKGTTGLFTPQRTVRGISGAAAGLAVHGLENASRTAREKTKGFEDVSVSSQNTSRLSSVRTSDLSSRSGINIKELSGRLISRRSMPPAFEFSFEHGLKYSYYEGRKGRTFDIHLNKQDGFAANRTKIKNGIFLDRRIEKTGSVSSGRISRERRRTINGREFKTEISAGKGGLKIDIRTGKGAGLIFTKGELPAGMVEKARIGDHKLVVLKKEKTDKPKLTGKQKAARVAIGTAAGVAGSAAAVLAASRTIGRATGKIKRIKNAEDLNAKVAETGKMLAGSLGRGITKRATANIRRKVSQAVRKAVAKTLKTLAKAIPIHIKAIIAGLCAVIILILCLFQASGSGVSSSDIGFTSSELGIETDGWGEDGTLLAINGVYLTWPLDYECTESIITSYFGYRSSSFTNGVGSTYHRGIDLGVAAETKIYAAADGVVAESGYDSSYGNYVVIEHDGFYTYYMHMIRTPSVSAGDIVEAGDEIGQVGSTGSSTGNHLHFGLSTSLWADFIDPYYYLFGTSSAADASDLDLLAAAIYCEADQEDTEGGHNDRLAVGYTIINRVNSSSFPDTIFGVISASGQFSSYSSGKIDEALENNSATEDCYAVAEEVLSDQADDDYPWLYFHARYDSDGSLHSCSDCAGQDTVYYTEYGNNYWR